MFNRLADWLDERSGYRGWLAPIRRRVVPGGPSWAYTTAICLVWLLVIEIVTGLLLMSSYSPSMTDAWASVHYIEQSPAGSFIRGLHYFTAQAMMILFAAHTVRVLLAAAFRAPHELIWVTGLLLIPVMIVWAITGNPLSGTQTGSSQIEVEGNIIASTPVIGPLIQRVLIGGDEVGNLTLTHLYSLHVGVFPFLAGLLLLVHISQVYKHGLAAGHHETKSGQTRPYWPYQSARNVFVFGIVFSVIAVLAWKMGAPLEAPADPQLPHSPRPEWYFFFLFELRRYFVGSSEWIATMLLPAASMLLLLAMPAIDRAFSRRVSAVIRGLVVLAGLGAFSILTFMSVWRDRHDEDHQASLAAAEQFAKRARQLANERGVSTDGAIALLRNDPETQGPLLFQQNCLACHSHSNADGKGLVAEKASAPNLHQFGTEEWIAGMLDPDQIVSDTYFGKCVQLNGDMVGAIKEAFADTEDAAAKEAKVKNMRLVALALAAEAQSGSAPGSGDPSPDVQEGIRLMTEELGCVDCHRFRESGELGSAPDLTGYASRDWLRGMISNPEHERFYGGGKNDRMPAFAKDPDAPQQNLLTDREIDLLVHWLVPKAVTR